MVNEALMRFSGRFWASNPAFEFAQYHFLDNCHAAWGVVETGNGREVLAARVLENLGILHGDFLQSLQAVSRNPRSDDGDGFYAALGQRFHGGIGVGLEPLGNAEARLKGQQQLLIVETELGTQQRRGLAAVALIGIALLNILLGYAVK